jgi:hypothetical protein
MGLAAWLACCCWTCAFAQSGGSGSKETSKNAKLEAVQAASAFYKRENIVNACNEFEKVTGCKVIVASHVEDEYKSNSAAQLVTSIMSAIVSTLKETTNVICIEVIWRKTESAYVTSINATMDKSMEFRFPKDAFKQFSDTLQQYTKVVERVGETNADKYIIQALEHLQQDALEYDGEGAVTWEPIDHKHAVLFNHVYKNNNLDDHTYAEQVGKSVGKEESLPLNYTEKDENEWVNQWKLRTGTSLDLVNKVMSKIQKADKGKKIEKMVLKEKGIYVGLIAINNVGYPVAIYSEKDVIENIKKVQVDNISDLEKNENGLYLRSDETFIKYLTIAFYEDGTDDPVLTLQIEKLDYSQKQDTKEVWMKYLNILTEEEQSKVNNKDILIKNAMWIGQFDSQLKSKPCHWCGTVGNCSNGGTPCASCPGNTSRQCCQTDCSDNTKPTDCDSCSQNTICVTSLCKTNNCCYQTTLLMLEKFGVTTNRSQAIDVATLIDKTSWRYPSDLLSSSANFETAVQYIDKALESGKPILIGTHYNNTYDIAYNTNSATFHYMVIVGRSIRDTKKYYRFYDPGRTTKAEGDSESNLLEVNASMHSISGMYRGKTYTITEIRKNTTK